jgi:glycosyltransferase involved in cell wall biosynthesis
MKILIAGSPSKIFHLKELKNNLISLKVETKLVIDTEIYEGFPSRNLKKWFQTTKKFNKLIDDFKPDVILIDRQHTLFDVAAVETKIPVFVLLRGDYWSEIKWAKETLYRGIVMKTVIKIKEKRAEKCFQGSTVILPICNYLKDIVKNNYPEKPANVLYQGIDPSKWYPEEGVKLKHPCVGLLQGAVIWGKAQEMLILEKVLKEMPDVTFYWVGDGPYREKILPVLEKYDNFKWLGALQYPDKVRQYLTEIDVYALVSGIDMSPLTLLEAQLMKKPVVATNVGGIPELMKDNETGFLVQKGNSEELIEKLLLLLNDKQKRENMGNMGRKFVEENFSWNKIAKEFVKDLKKIIVIKKKNVNLND